MAELTWRVTRNENGESSFVHENAEQGIFIRVAPVAWTKVPFVGHASLHGKTVWQGSVDSLESAADAALEAIKSATSGSRKAPGGETF